MDSIELIDNIISTFGCRNQNELAKFLGVDRSQITRWKKTGFHSSTARLIGVLLDAIKTREKPMGETNPPANPIL